MAATSFTTNANIRHAISGPRSLLRPNHPPSVLNYPKSPSSISFSTVLSVISSLPLSPLPVPSCARLITSATLQVMKRKSNLTPMIKVYKRIWVNLLFLCVWCLMKCQEADLQSKVTQKMYFEISIGNPVGSVVWNHRLVWGRCAADCGEFSCSLNRGERIWVQGILISL